MILKKASLIRIIEYQTYLTICFVIKEERKSICLKVLILAQNQGSSSFNEYSIRVRNVYIKAQSSRHVEVEKMVSAFKIRLALLHLALKSSNCSIGTSKISVLLK